VSDESAGRVAAEADRAARHAGSVAEVVWAFLKLGLISFGGPIAHLGIFQRVFVRERKWLSDARFAELLALCQFLPGPASSQMALCIGRARAGLIGGVLASVVFLLPSAVIMIALAYGAVHAGAIASSPWVHGLKLAAVVIVAQAVWSMARKLWRGWLLVAIGVLACAGVVVWGSAWVQVGVIVLAGLAAWLIGGDRSKRGDELIQREGEPGEVAGAMEMVERPMHSRRSGVMALGVLAALLVALPMVSRLMPTMATQVSDGFTRAGAMVFGGGHVVLPMLREEVVPRGWMSDETFLAGYAGAQAIPGPLFTFAGYVATTARLGGDGGGTPGVAWLFGMLGIAAIFLPGWLLIVGALPFWAQLRRRAWAQRALAGANAAVVGILLAALYDPVLTAGVRSTLDAVVAAVVFVVAERWKLPGWAVVLVVVAVVVGVGVLGGEG
jgi:chromate transporter